MIDYLATFINTNGSAFPNTAAKNETSPGAADGTEFIKALIDDIWGARQALLDEVSLAPDGVTEAVGASQQLDALKLLIAQEGTVSFATNGYVKLPNGLIVQWGVHNNPAWVHGGVETVNFNIAFPTAVLFITAEPNSQTISVTSGSYPNSTRINDTNTTLSSFTVAIGNNPGATVDADAQWIAIGY